MFIYLFINPASIVLDVGPQSAHDGVPSAQGGPGQLQHGGVLPCKHPVWSLWSNRERERVQEPTEVESLSPGLVLAGSRRVSQLTDLTDPGRGPEIKYLGVGRSEERPGVAASITVSWVSSYQDPGLPSSVVLLVDGIFVAEGIVPCGDCTGGLWRARWEEELSECYDGVDDGSVLLSPGTLVDVLTIVVMFGRVNYFPSNTSVGLSNGGFTWRFRFYNIQSVSLSLRSPRASAN